MSKSLVVDKIACQGFARCEAVAGALLRLNGRRIATVIKQPTTDEELAEAKAAVRSCPRFAIALVGPDGR
jgi:ferredoxin